MTGRSWGLGGYRTRLPLAAALAALLLLCTVSLALAAAQVSGRVTDASGAAVPGATVALLDPVMGSAVASATTDATGHYSLSVPTDTYDVQVSPPSGSGFSASLTRGQAISADTVLDFVLVPAGIVTVSGRVLDPHGNGVSGAQVALTGSGGASTATDASGAYALHVSAGSYGLRVENWGQKRATLPDYVSVGTRSTLAFAQDTVMDIAIPARPVRVTVQDPAGNPVAGVQLATQYWNSLSAGFSLATSLGDLSASGLTQSTRSTGPDGAAILWLLPSADPYTITATPPTDSAFGGTSAPASVGAGAGDVAVAITLPPTFAVSGRVLDGAGSGVPGLQVSLSGSGGASTTTDSAGAYVLRVPAGSYTLRVENWGQRRPALPDYLSVGTRSPVVVAADTALDISIPAKQVRVQVRTPAGDPVAGVSVATQYWNSLSSGFALHTSVGDLVASGLTQATRTSDATGALTLWLAPSGDPYTFNAAPPVGSVFGSTNVSAMVTDDATLSISLPQTVVVSGRVVDGEANGTAGVQVSLTGSGGASATTDAAGAYSLRVPTGSYGLRVENWGQQRPALPDYASVGTSAPVQVSQDMTLDIAIPAKRVHVQVQDPAGNPVSGVQVATQYWNSLSGGFALQTSVGSLPASGLTQSTRTTGPAGDLTLWLLPSADAYALAATPPSGSPFASFSSSGVIVSSDRSLVFVLQFVHAPPVTTAIFDPLGTSGVFPGPVKVTLSATAAAGFTVAQTTYSVDGGPKQAYAGPFTVSGEGSHTLTVQSTDNAGVFEIPRTLSVTIAPLKITTTSLPNGRAGFTYDARLTASGGVPPYAWSVTPGQLPAGLSLDAASGRITGTPSVFGSFALTATVADATGANVSRQVALPIAEGNHPPIANPNGPYGVVMGGAAALTGAGSDADGDPLTYEWDLDADGSFETAGQVVTFSAAGRAAPARQDVALRVCDPYGLCALAQTYVDVLSPLQITTQSPLPSGTLSVRYSTKLQATGGTLPYVWSLDGGALPPGLQLDGATGEIAGVPTAVGSFAFTVRVSDASHLTTTKQLTLAPPPPPPPDAGNPYPETPIVIVPPVAPPPDGGTAPPPPPCTDYVLAPGSDPLPPGMTLDPATGILKGTPTNGGTYKIVVQCTYGTNQTATADFVLTINNPVPVLQAIDPVEALAGGGDFVLTLTGTNFVGDSTVRWNGAMRATTYVSATELRTAIPAADVAAAGAAELAVANPGPGGGTSNTLRFTIKNPDTTPPVIEPAVEGPRGANGWYVGAVTVSWTVGDPESGIASSVGCGSTTVSGETGGATLACAATNGVGLSASASIAIALDRTPPISAASVTGTVGENGWFKAGEPVTLALIAADALSGVDGIWYRVDDGAERPYTGTVAFGNGVHHVAYWSRDRAGNVEPARVLTLRVDGDPPTITASATSGSREYRPGTWTNQDVVVVFACDDALSGLASCSPAVLLTGDGADQTVEGTAVDNAGNIASANVAVSIDKSPPTVVYAGNAGTYTVDQTITITCTAADATSGLASSTCRNVDSPAYAYPLDVTTLSASATDRAGNSGTGATAFTIRVTDASLCALVRRFVSNAGIATSLCVKLNAAAASAARGNLTAKAGQVGAFVNEVAAQSGKALTADQAAILTRLARAL